MILPICSTSSQDAALKLAEAKRWAQLPDLYRRALKAIDVKQWQDAATLLTQVQSVDANYRESKTLLARVRESALAELYDRAAQAIDAQQWEQAKALLEQIKNINPSYRDTTARLESVKKNILPRSITNPKDGKEMLLVPAGEFMMGSNDGEEREKPPHKVYLDTFYISRYPVTNAEYKKFVDATKRDVPSHWSGGKIPQGKENHPVVNVSWDDAVEYCKWAGARLPTEAEWEKAARGTDERKYPWGNEFDASKCNSAESKIGDTTLVGKYSPQGDSPYGIADMAGNVWEWCSTLYKGYPYDAKDGREDMQASGTRVLRGGAFDFESDRVRAARRRWLPPNYWNYDVGFRVVAGAS